MLRRTTICALILLALCAFFAVDKAKAQTVWGISGYDYDETFHQLYGYHATELDYYAWLYYDAYVEGYIYDQNGNEIDFDSDLDTGGMAEAYTQTTYEPGETYYVISDHYVGAYYSQPSSGGGGGLDFWDPFGFGYTVPGGGYGGFFSYMPTPGGYMTYQYYYLGWTGWEITFAGQPHIDQMVPTSAPLGVSIEVNFSGTDFGTAPTINVGGSGVTVGSISYSTDTRLTAIFHIADNASTGNHSVSISSNGSTSNSVNLNVGDRTPQINSINPSGGDAGAVVPVTISGQGFGSTPIVNVTGGINVSITSRNDTQITANFSIPSTTLPGDHQVTVFSNGYGGTGFISGGGSSSTSNAVNFTVNAQAAPHIISCAPQSAQLGVSIEINVIGENFGQTRTLQITGQGVTVQSYTPVADPDHQIVAILNVAENAETGNHSITVSAGGLTSNSVNFQVGDRSPTITGIAPPSGIKGTNTQVVLTGRGFGTNPQLAISGNGVNITINSATDTRITATFAISGLAELTTRQVTLTSQGISGNGFMQSPGATPNAQTNFGIEQMEVKINSWDAFFAPGAERLDVNYTITPPGAAASFGKLEIFKKGDEVNPVFRDEQIQKTGTVQYSQGGVQGWDGKANLGSDSSKFMGPENSPYKVKITIAMDAGFGTVKTATKDFKIEIHSYTTTPADSAKFGILKPWPVTTPVNELDTTITLKVLLKGKSGAGTPSAVPYKVEWSFKDPDDTSGDSVVDSNGNQPDDNAPVAEGGKRGGNSPMWKAVQGFTTTVDQAGQTATSDLSTTVGPDLGTTKIKFSSSSIGGDNYVLRAQVKGAAPKAVKDIEFEKWSVRKTLDFTEAYQMPGGAPLLDYISVNKVEDAFKDDGYTDYTLGNNGTVKPYPVPSPSPGATPSDYLADLQDPIALLTPTGQPNPNTELPTTQETTDYGSSVPAVKAAAKAAIEAKAQRWYDRNQTEILNGKRRTINAVQVTGSTIYGLKHYHVKYDGIEGDGRPAGSAAYYPTGIVISAKDGQGNPVPGSAIDPNKDWNQNASDVGPPRTRVSAMEVPGTLAGQAVKFILIFLSTDTATRKEIIGRHEVGHASDHVLFGLATAVDPLEKDHWTNGLMHWLADQSLTKPDGEPKFASDSILRLRGRKR